MLNQWFGWDKNLYSAIKAGANLKTTGISANEFGASVVQPVVMSK